MASVTFEHVTKRFGGSTAVRDLSLEVRDGELLVLTGPSGCGKTTLLRMLAGLEEPTSGEIHIGGRRVTNLPSKDRDIAMVFQSYTLYPQQSARDNIAFGLKLRGMPKAEIERRVKEVADALELEPSVLSRKPKELSGGQRQRVALAGAIAREPGVLVLDEPLSNLDAPLRLKTRALLQEIHRRTRRTMIYVTHDQGEAIALGDRIAVMSDGAVARLTRENDGGARIEHAAEEAIR